VDTTYIDPSLSDGVKDFAVETAKPLYVVYAGLFRFAVVASPANAVNTASK
jgi:hypothetical protein